MNGEESSIFEEMGETAYGKETWRDMQKLGRGEIRSKRVIAFMSNIIVVSAGLAMIALMAAVVYGAWHWVTR